MTEVKRQPDTPRYVPDYMAASINDIDFSLLADRGIKFIAFDADSTLVPYRGIEIAPGTIEFLRKQRKLFKQWCIASNRITHDLPPLAQSIDASIIQATWTVRKPQRRYFRRVLNHFKAKPNEVAMIGDKLIADMYGGKRSGLTTVWVEHLGQDSLLDRIIRLRANEKRLLRHYIK